MNDDYIYSDLEINNNISSFIINNEFVDVEYVKYKFNMPKIDTHVFGPLAPISPITISSPDISLCWKDSKEHRIICIDCAYYPNPNRIEFLDKQNNKYTLLLDDDK